MTHDDGTTNGFYMSQEGLDSVVARVKAQVKIAMETSDPERIRVLRDRYELFHARQEGGALALLVAELEELEKTDAN